MAPGQCFLFLAIPLGVTKCAVKKGALRWTIFGLSDTDFCHLTPNISKTVSHQLELNISSTGLSKNVAVLPGGGGHKAKYVLFFEYSQL